VALYVLNHKRGHLRDLESSFKVTLSVIADASVNGPQSFIIDRGEQVHTLEAAKALLVAQAAASPPQLEEAYDDDEPFDVELEADVETEESEGLSDEVSTGEAGADAADGGHRRRRRRRRRGRGGETREAGPPREDGEAPALFQEAAIEETAEADEAESVEDEAEEQARQDQAGGGERRPRRRGRRGGRRRRAGDDGLASSISDELAPPPQSEAVTAVADFDGVAPAFQPDSEPVTATAEAQPIEPEEPAADPVAPAPEADKHAPRRSTVREKVSFAPNPIAEAAIPVTSSEEPAPDPRAAADEPAETAPRRAGWWSRRFGNGQ
jgi:ribonuclease E